MKTNSPKFFAFYGLAGELPFRSDDVIARRLAMLIDSKCHGLGPEKTAQKYGYSVSRYYQLQRAYRERGVAALADQKKGPQGNYVRTDVIENQIIRYRFLEPRVPPSVITQRLNQRGYRVSQRSVERTITKYGIQKKLYTLNPQKEPAERTVEV